MNQERSHSRERPNTYKQQQNDQYQSPYNYQRPSLSDRIIEERSSSNPKQYNQNSLYPPYQGQFKRSPSPINKLQKQSKPSSNLNPSQHQTAMQKLSLKDINLKKIQKLQQLQTLLKSIKKPFQPSDLPSFQSIIEKLTPKYKFQHLYSTFLYFFIHYSLLDENIYRMFYGIIAKGTMQMDNFVEINQNPLVGFYDLLIKSTIKVTFDEFIKLFKQTKKINVESYFMISQQQRQKILNKSLYPSLTGQVGSSIRNTLTLIRKSMQRQKVSGQRSVDFIHPIRQILKLLKTTIKSLLQKIFTTQQQSSLSQQVESNNAFYLILFSELSIVIHSKYKHHLTAEYEETLNEITILKMKLTQIKQQIQTKFFNNNLKKQDFSTLREQQENIKALQFNYERLKKQHDNNYLYLLFVINLSTFNRNSSVGENLDSTIYSFYIEPLIDEYKKSSQFLAQKIQQNINKIEKLRFFLSTVKNYGLYEPIQKYKEGTSRQKLWRFVNLSYSNVILKSINYIGENDESNKQNRGEKILCILNSLLFKQSSFNKINELKSIKSRINNIKRPNQMEIQEQKSIKSTHLEDELSFLIQDLINAQLKNVIKKRNKILHNFNKNNLIVDTKGHMNKTQILSQKPQQNGQQLKIKQSQKYQQHLLNIIKYLKQYFKNKQNYQKLLIFLYLLYKNNNLQQSLIFIDQYQSLNKQLKKQKRSQDIIDIEDEVIESLTEKEKILIKLNLYVSKKVMKIKSINSCENNLLKQLLQNLSQNKQQIEISSTVQLIKSFLLKIENSQKLLISCENISFIGFMLHEHEQQQKNMINKFLSQIRKRQSTQNIQQLKNTNSSNFISSLINQIQQLGKLIGNYLQIKQSYIKLSMITSIQRLINEKKTQLLQKDINQKLTNILNKIISIHTQYFNKNKTQQSSSIMINLQIVIETLLIKLFQFEKQKSIILKNDPFKEKVIKNWQNQKQIRLKNKLTNAINIALINQKLTNIIQSIYTSRQSILSHILATIYKKFLSFSNQNQQSNKQNITSLQDLLILKLKKCISLFYDKINDYMLNQFILQKRLFILRCLAITFYKMKQLSQMILNKYGILGKAYGSNLSPEMTTFVQDIFFFIHNKQALQSYLKFITTRDRFFIKTQLKKYHSLTNGKVDKLIQMVDGM